MSLATSLPPPIRPTRSPAYHQLNDQPKAFEHLTRRLLVDDPSLRTAVMYGVSGQKQYGIDVLCDLSHGPGRVAASCKCLRTVSPADLKTWSEDFLKHRERRWPDVRRFILVTSATNITNTNLLDQRDAEARRFAALGIEYVLWGPDELDLAIQSADRSVARIHLGAEWEELFHGRDRGAEFDAAQVTHLSRLQGLVSEQAAARLVLATEMVREGRFAAAASVVTELCQPSTWSQLTAPVQAHVLRLDAQLADAAGEEGRAQDLAGRALVLDPAERRISALLAAKGSGPAAGLKVLIDVARRTDRQLEAGLLLEDHQLAVAAQKIDALIREDPDDAESVRLLAHLRLQQGRRNEALVAARHACDLAPNRLGAQRVLAMASYAAALSPMASLEQTALPNPSDPALVRTNTAGLAALHTARDLFQRLSEGGTAHSLDSIWLLACHANLEAGREAASSLCQVLLAKDPTSTAAIVWGVARHLDFDAQPSLVALQARYDAGQAGVDQMRALVMLSGAGGTANAIQAALEPNLGRQPAEVAEVAQRILQAVKSAPPADGSTPLTPDEALALASRGDWSQVEALLETMLGAERPTQDGLALARACAGARRWTSLLPYAEVLTRFETADPVELAALALHHAGTPEAVLALLAEQHDSFPAAGPSLTIRRLEIHAIHSLGDFPKALERAERLASETLDMFDRLRAADIHIAAGHTQAALPVLRVAVGTGSLTSDEAVKYSIAITRDDRALAIQLWRQAMDLGVSDLMLLHALSQGHKLGLDAETGPLFPRVHDRAASGAGDVWMVDVDDVIQQIIANRDRSENLKTLLAAGGVPIHLVAKALNQSVAELLWLKPRMAAKGALSPLFLRHGGRPAGHRPAALWSRWRLHLDLTGLLIADQLNLWHHIDALSAPVIVSRSLPDALIKLEHDAAHHQLTQISAAEAIRDARLTDRLALQSSHASTATTIRLDGEGDEDEPGLPLSVVVAVATGESAVADAPGLGQRLTFGNGALHALAMTEHFDAVLEAFDCAASQEDVDDALAELTRAAARETLAGWIDEVKKKVAARLEDGRFAFPPLKSTSRMGADGAQATLGVEDDDDLAEGQRDFVEDGLMELLAAEGDETCALWIDDRTLSGYRHAEGKIIVGVSDVLDALLAEGRITSQARHAALLMLRRAGAVFLPLEKQEVLAALQAAPILDGKVAETPTLAAYRRNLATATRLDAHLKLGPSDIETLKDRPDEVAFMLDSRRVTSEVLRAIWEDATLSDDEARARSEWVWASLRLEQPLRVLPGGDEAAQLLSSLAIGALLAYAPHIAGAWEASAAPSRRQAFADWLDETAIRPREGPGAEQFFDLIADQIASLVDRRDAEKLAKAAGTDAPHAERALALHFQQLFDLMPEPIQARLVQNPAYALAAGLGSIDLVTLEGVTFPAQAFWSACAHALRTGSASVETQDGVAVGISEEKGGLTFSGGLEHRVREAYFPALKAEGEEQAAAVCDFLVTLDLASEDAAAAAKAVAASTCESDLVTALQVAQGASVVHLYGRLANSLRDHGGVVPEMFAPPSAERLLHHLRLKGREASIADGALQAWIELAAKIGVRHAFRRLSGLPTALDGAITASVTTQALRLEDLGMGESPTARLHLAAVAQRLGRGTDAQTALAELMADMDAGGQLFTRLLAWSFRAYVSEAAWRALGPGAQLAVVWSHAHRICTLLLEHRVKANEAIGFLDAHPPPRELGADQWRRRALDADCASPTFFFPSAMVYHGLAYVFGDEDVFAAAPELASSLRDFPFLDPKARGDLQPGVVTRDGALGNAMGSILQLRPIGLLPDGPEPDIVRADYLETAFAALEADPTLQSNWFQLLAFGQSGLSDKDRDRLDKVFDAFDLADLDLDGPTPIHGEYGLVIDTRVRLGGPIDDNRLSQKLYDLAAQQASRLKGRFSFDDGGAAAVSWGQVMEAAARGAEADDISRALERLASFSLAIAAAWPASASSLRRVFDAYARRMSPSDGAPLWKVLVILRTWP